jgi:transposase
MTHSKTWRFDYFIGIDVSKETLDLVLMYRNDFLEHYTILNNVTEINSIIKKMRTDHNLKLPRSVFGMEHTGVYCNHLLVTLNKLKAQVVLEDAKHIRGSLGIIRGKTDMVDAKRIAGYLSKSRNQLRLFVPKREIVDELARLNTVRSRLITMQTNLRKPLKEEQSFILKQASSVNYSLCSETIKSIASDIAKLDKYVKELYTNDERISHLMKLVTSIPGIGVITALHIISATNEFKNFSDPRKFACYCGVAPFKYESGTSVRLKTKVSHMANKKIKALLHNCAITARVYVPELKEYYVRRTEVDGKPKMSVLNAIRFKLILRIFTCVSQNRTYIDNYDSTASNPHIPKGI